MTFAESPLTLPEPADLSPPTVEWRNLPAEQQPVWPDRHRVLQVQDGLSLAPALTAPADVRRLGSRLARAQAGDAFLLQAGDCAEPVGSAGCAAVRGKHRIIGEMAESISDGSDLPTIAVGRIAGQYAKPRTQSEEMVGGRSLPVYRGDMVNAHAADAKSRTPDPERMLTAYATARSVLNELHLIAHETASAAVSWDSQQDPEQGLPTQSWDGSLRSVLKGYGQTTRAGGTWRHSGLWTSHEALVLDYEQCLVRRDAHTGEDYLLSTHLPWIGERTRHADGAHVSFLARLANPVACKVGPSVGVDALLRLCARLDPNRRPGRLALIGRFGADRVRQALPDLVKAVRSAGHQVVWVCDPMHGNTVTTSGGVKTRRMEDILTEMAGFFDVMFRAGEWPGGVHLEIAGAHVTECVGEGGPEDETGLGRAYRTLCDPRLNDNQALLAARAVSERLSRG